MSITAKVNKDGSYAFTVKPSSLKLAEYQNAFEGLKNQGIQVEKAVTNNHPYYKFCVPKDMINEENELKLSFFVNRVRDEHHLDDFLEMCEELKPYGYIDPNEIGPAVSASIVGIAKAASGLYNFFNQHHPSKNDAAIAAATIPLTNTDRAAVPYQDNNLEIDEQAVDVGLARMGISF